MFAKEEDIKRNEETELEEVKKRPPMDRYILAIYLTLCVISVVELYSASSREVSPGHVFYPLLHHIAQLAIGMVICFLVSRYPYRWLVGFTPVIAIISAALMLYVLVGGEVINGARRGIRIMGTLVLPAEMLKLSAVLVIARYTARYQLKEGGVTDRGIAICAAVVVLFSGLLFTQGLTNTILLMCISLAMMLIGGIEMKKFLIVCMIYALLAGGAIIVKSAMGSDKEEGAKETTEKVEGGDAKSKTDRSETWLKRIMRWKSDSIPKYDQKITAENRQEMYSYMAQANGGLIGVGPGNSRETARLPLAFSDYIYSIVVEDTGFIGGIFLLIVYLSLLARGGIVASRCDRLFPALLIMGLAVMICIQALFHMAIVTGVFPVSGQPLPMISKGGMSIYVTSFAFGVMLSVSRYAAEISRKGKKKGEDDLPESMDAVNPTAIRN